jgi:IS4 transposase
MPKQLDKNLLRVYSDYLLTSFSYTTSTGLSNVLNREISNSKISRFLGGNYQEKGELQYTEYSSKDLWSLVKETVRKDEFEEGVLVIDDTVEEKQYTDENEVNCWHFDHTLGRSVKGVNMLNFLYLGQEMVIPITLEIIKKPEIFIDKDGKQKRKSKVTKNQLVQENINQIVKNKVKFKYVVMDTWFACNETLELIHKHKKIFVVPLKSNRNIALSISEKIKGGWIKLDNEELNQQLSNTQTTIEIWLEGLSFPVFLTKQVFTNQDGSIAEMFLITNDKTLNSQANEIHKIYHRRWKVEEFYKSLKSNLAFSKAPTKNTFTQISHFFCSVYAYFQTEILLKTTKFKNHFELKSSLYFKALKSAMIELEVLKARVGCER